MRGLKQANAATMQGQAASHPTWVRGLKHECSQGSSNRTMSHPTWVRGLKPGFPRMPIHIRTVAPYVGAWIETRKRPSGDLLPGSHPTWVRGLKHPLTIASGIHVSRTLRGCVD